MKGIVFTEFLDLVENKFGYEVVDQIISDSNLESKGIYTAVGTYSHFEIVELLTNLSKEVKIEPEVLLKEFGKYLFDTFLRTYPQFFHQANGAFEFLHSIDKHIHVEVLKLYPDAALPKFDSKEVDGVLTMTYQSERKMSGLAEGLIEKSIAHYNEDYQISKEKIEEDGSIVEFTIKKK